MCASECEQKNWNAENLQKEMFGHLEDVNSLSLNFHMLGHIVADVSQFDNLAYLDVSSYELYNITIKKCVVMTSMRKGTTIKEVACVMNATAIVTVLQSKHLRVEKHTEQGLDQIYAGHTTQYHMFFNNTHNKRRENCTS